MTGRSAREDDDAGFTLIEVMVGMAIMGIFLAMFGGSLISMFKSVNRTQQTAYAQSQTNQLFLKLDKQLRYASGISQPASNVFATGDSVVEFVTSYTGSPVCTQLRLAPTGELQERTWGQNDVPIVVSAPVPLAVDLDADTPKTPAGPNVLVAGPFALMSATGDLSNQRLEVALSARDSSNVSTTTRSRSIDVTFTALNTGTSTSSNSVCAQGRSIAWPAP